MYLNLHIYLSIYLSIDLSIYRSIYLSIYLSICKLENAALPRDFLDFWNWQRQKRNNSARLLHFSNLTTSKTKQFCETSSFFSWQHQKRSNSARLLHFSKLTRAKTKQFCETSSIFEIDNVKNETIQTSSFFKPDNINNEAILRNFLIFRKWKVECRADGLVPLRFAIFPVHLSKVLRLPRKSDARSYEVLHLSRKIISAKLRIWGSKLEPLSGNQRPDLLTALMKMSLVLRLPRKMHLCRSSSNAPRLPSFFEMLQNPHVLLTFDKVHNPLHLPRGATSERPKVVRTHGVFNILTSKCASRHNGVHFFDISTSKNGPNVRCF